MYIITIHKNYLIRRWFTSVVTGI